MSIWESETLIFPSKQIIRYDAQLFGESFASTCTLFPFFLYLWWNFFLMVILYFHHVKSAKHLQLFGLELSLEKVPVL